MNRNLAVAALAALSLAACSSDEDNGKPNDPGTPTQAKASLRVLHLSPDAPAVDVFASGTKLVTSLAFGSGTDFVSVDAKAYDVAVAATGEPEANAVLRVEDVQLVKDGRYTAVAWNRLDAIAALLLQEDASAPPEGQIRVRVVHTAAAIDTVDVWALGETNTKLIDGLAKGAAAEPLTLPSAAYRVGVDADRDGTPDVVFDIPALPAGTVANVFAVTDAAGNPFLLAQLDGATTVRLDPTPPAMDTAEIRVAHLVPDVSGVDVFVDGATPPAVGALGFEGVTAYLQVPAGARDLAVAPAGQGLGSAVIELDDVDLAMDTASTAIAYGSAIDLRSALLQDDRSAPAAGQIRVRLFHGASAVPTVDVWALGETPAKIVDGLAYGAASDALVLPAGAYRVGLDLNEDATPDATFQIPELAAGTVATVFAVNEVDGTPFLLAAIDGGGNVRIDAEAPPQTAKLRALHLSPDAPDVDIFVDGAIPAAVQGLAFGAGTGYLDLPVGARTVAIAAEGEPVQNAVLTETVTLQADRSYTAAAIGFLDGLQLLRLEDSRAPVPGTSIRIRAIHAAASVGTVDIWNVTEGSAPAPLWENVPFGAVGAYLEVPSQAYTLGVDVNDDAVPDVLFDVPALPAGTIANVFAVPEGEGVKLVAQLQDGTIATIMARPEPASVRVIHLSPDAPNVDVFAGDSSTPVFADIAFGEQSALAEIVPGDLRVRVAPLGQGPGAAVIDATLGFDPGTFTTVAAYDRVASLKTLVLADDFADVSPEHARIRPVHTASAVGTVDIWDVTAEPSPLWPGLAFGQIGEYLEVPVTERKLGFDVNADGIPDVTFQIPTLPGGSVINAYAVSDAEGNVFLLAQIDETTLVRIDPLVD